MFLFLSKFLPLFVYPIGLTCALIGLALILRRKPRGQMIVLIVTLALLWVGGNRWVAMGLARSLEWRYLPPDTIPAAEVIVLLGGGTEPGLAPRPTVGLNSAADREFFTAWLYKQGKAPNILVTGREIEWLAASDKGAGDMATVLEALGVPAEAIWLENESLNTYENAVFCRKILEEKGIHRVILVTSASHMPRSVALFEKQGIEVIPAPTDFSVTQADWQRLTHPNLPSLLISLMPTVDNLSTTTRAAKEYLGIFVYWLRGWL